MTIIERIGCGATEVGKSHRKFNKWGELVWACDAIVGALCGKEGD